MSVNSKMTAIADKIRTLLGITSNMGLDAMASNIGKAQNEVDRQAALIEQIRTVLASKVVDGNGGIIPTGTKNITENGIYDVTTYANVDVSINVLPDGITALRLFPTDLSSVNGSMGVRLNHRLGKTPDFYFLFSYLPQGVYIDGSPNTVLNICVTKNLFEDAQANAEVTEAITYVNDTGEVATVLDSGRISGYFDEENITVFTPSNAVFRTDGLYYVVVGCYEE